tara:strand:- start:698 stop:1609 length:912 start_codon:yes stop_codon:yes gene_type:complete
MRNYFGFILVVLIISCDKIESPLPEEFGKFDWSLYPQDPSSYNYNLADPSTNWDINTNPKGILLEDYTGHKCTNCPAAAQTAKYLEDDSTKNVIVTSIHASADGSFQATDGLYVNDYRTIAGDEYISEMTGFLGNPMGTINRNSQGLSGSVWYLASEWNNGVNNTINQPLLANIQLKKNYFPSTNGLFIHTETSFLSPVSGDFHLIIYLVRNDVISPQKFNNGVVDTNYYHHAVLSANINGTWGSLINDGGVADETTIVYKDFSYQLPDPTINPSYNIENLSLITYLCNRNSYEIIQVIKTDI